MFDKHLINSINIDGKDIVINREEYINEILEYKDKNLIKVLSGMRRCGKSEIMKHYILKLKTLGIKDENILFIQLQNKSTYEFRDYLSMTKYILGLLNNNNEKYYIFLDEIQEIEEFEKSIVELFEHNNFDLYISGSNSKLLSSNLSTLLTGRKIIINIYPLSFNECFRFLNLNFNKSEDEVWLDYITYGGLPERFSFKSEEKIFQYIRSVFNDILVHDILNKNSIQNVTNFYNFANFIMSNSAKRLSVKKAENLINDVYKTKYDRTTIANFINYLIESFLIVKIDYLNSTTMDILKNSRRYYANDIGLKNSLSEKNIFSKGRTIENIIFIELLNRGYTVNGFCMYDTNSKVDENSSTAKEIDFIAKKNNKSFNIQVTINLVEENYSREIGNFKFVKNGFENILLSMDKNLDRIPGVRTVNIIDWLLKKVEL